MQLTRNALLLASLFAMAPATVVESRVAEEANRPHKHSGRYEKRNPSLRSEMAEWARSEAAASSAKDEWESKKGMLHLEAAEVETEAATDIKEQEDLNKREEHQELAARESHEKAQVEAEAARNWEAVARAAEAEALQLKQDAAAEVGAAEDGAAYGASPGPAPGPAPHDFSWAMDMAATKPVPEQGFEGEHVLHVDQDTMTGDWQKEHPHDFATELCKVCARHPDNSWCQGKCPGVGGQAASPPAPVTEAVEPPAPSAGSEPQPSAPEDESAVEERPRKEKSAAGIFGTTDPLFGRKGLFGKDGVIADTFKDIFGGAASRGALAALLPVALVVASQ